MSEAEELHTVEDLRAALRHAQAEVSDLHIQLHSANTAVIRLRERRVEAILGVGIERDRQAQILQALDFTTAPAECPNSAL